LDSLARNVDVPGSVPHHDEKLGDVGLDMMLSPVQGTTIEDCDSRGLLQSDAFPHETIVPRDHPCPRTPGSGHCLVRSGPSRSAGPSDAESRDSSIGEAGKVISLG